MLNVQFNEQVEKHKYSTINTNSLLTHVTHHIDLISTPCALSRNNCSSSSSSNPANQNMPRTFSYVPFEMEKSKIERKTRQAWLTVGILR